MSSGTAPRSGDQGATTPARSSGGVSHQDHGRRLATETKAAYKTTEFLAFVLVVAGILISASSITGGGSHKDAFSASDAWALVSIVTLGYLISRGLAKAGSKQPYDER
jgi:hypothetical protein